MSFISELKRRNVFKVGVAYAIVAWLLIQVAATVLPTFDAPRWVQQTFTFLIILGFPLALFLAWAYELTPEGIKSTPSEGPAQFHTRTIGQRLNYFILGVLVLAVSFILVDNYLLKNTQHSTVVPSTTNEDRADISVAAVPTAATVASAVVASPSRRATLNLGLTQPNLRSRLNALVALSPDGLHLVYAVNTEKGMQLQHRSLDQLTSQPLPVPAAGTIVDVFFSPDGQWVGVGTGVPGALYKISLQGGPPQLLAEGYVAVIGHWMADGYIYFSVPNDQKLHRVRATGGTPEPVNVASELAAQYKVWPFLLPDRTHLLFTVSQGRVQYTGRIALLDLNTGQTRILIQSGYHASYVPTGHIVFTRSGSLWAVPFDVEQLKTTGPEVPVVNGVENSGNFGEAVYAFSDDGLLVYLPGENVQPENVSRQLVWIERDGTETPLPAKVQDYRFPHLSPDGTQAAFLIGPSETNHDIWVYDLARDILSRRTFSGFAVGTLWSPDGTRLVYTFYPNFQGLAWVKADGTGQPEKLLDAPRYLLPTAFTPDGSTLIYFESVKGSSDIYTLSLTGERTEQPLLTTEFDEVGATLSPDGRWLAYASNETGQHEIYVRPYPNVDQGKWQVSADGGVEPRWRDDGKELFYRQSPFNPTVMLAVPVVTDPGFQPGTPVELFRVDHIIENNNAFTYDVTADGQRFLFAKTVTESGENEAVTVVSRETNLVVVENWFAELKRLAPPSK